MPSAHIVFGAGQVGAPLAARLAAAGHPVTLVSRSGAGPSVPGVTAVRGDATDARFCIEIARDAAAVYHCMNPPYDAATWAAWLPKIRDNLVAAAARSGARLVVLDNIYSLGRPAGRLFSEDTPPNPCSRKGEIRARVAEALFAADRRGDVRVVVGRASDYYGPGGVQTMFERRFWSRALAGRAVQIVVNPDTRHSYHYIPDVAAGLATLGAAGDDVLGRWWMLPAAPAVTTRELIGKLGAALGHPLRIQRIPGWFQSALGLFIPLFREIAEMQYEWDEDFVVDDRRFRSRFGVEPTPLDEGAKATVAWAKAAFG
jgi:nucleoside-diphosphate-sugar epimerase